MSNPNLPSHIYPSVADVLKTFEDELTRKREAILKTQSTYNLIVRALNSKPIDNEVTVNYDGTSLIITVTGTPNDTNDTYNQFLSHLYRALDCVEDGPSLVPSWCCRLRAVLRRDDLTISIYVSIPSEGNRDYYILSTPTTYTSTEHALRLRPCRLPAAPPPATATVDDDIFI